MNSAQMLSTKVKKSAGFTLIELLVVIGIIGTLSAVALVAINPAEAQRKARDVQRLKDMATIQSIVEQYMNDNQGVINFAAAAVKSDDFTTGGVKDANKCATGWLSKAVGGGSLCSYANVIPTDPTNRDAQVSDKNGAHVTSSAKYIIKFENGAYKICTMLESTANKAKLTADGEATSNNYFAVFTSDAISCE